MDETAATVPDAGDVSRAGQSGGDTDDGLASDGGYGHDADDEVANGGGRGGADGGHATGQWTPQRSRYVPKRAPRTGEPWTDAEYEQILAAVREGVTDFDVIASRLGRSRHPTVTKARRLLPVAERAAPVDRVLRLLRGHLEDPSYDWERVTLEDPPPPPVVHPPALTGLAGLEKRDLLAVGYALALAGTAVDGDVVARVGDALSSRRLLHELVEYRTERMLHQPGAEITQACAASEARSWLQQVYPAAEDWSYHYADYEDEDSYSRWWSRR